MKHYLKDKYSCLPRAVFKGKGECEKHSPFALKTALGKQEYLSFR
jgi:hypothetical protein